MKFKTLKKRICCATFLKTYHGDVKGNRNNRNQLKFAEYLSFPLGNKSLVSIIVKKQSWRLS